MENVFNLAERQLNDLAKSVAQDKVWTDLFPGVASINITATGQGPSIVLRVSKKKDCQSCW